MNKEYTPRETNVRPSQTERSQGAQIMNLSDYEPNRVRLLHKQQEQTYTSRHSTKFERLRKSISLKVECYVQLERRKYLYFCLNWFILSVILISTGI